MPTAFAQAILTVLFGVSVFAQVVVHPPSEQISIGGLSVGTRVPSSPSWPFGLPHTRLAMEGLLAWSDGKMLSIELGDQRLIRFYLDDKTRYFPETASGLLASFHMTDFVRVESEVDNKGLLARSVRFLRRASPEEQAEIQQSPEVLQPLHVNLLIGSTVDPGADDRRLTLVNKPKPIAGYDQEAPVNLKESEFVQKNEPQDLIVLVRRSVNDSFENLPNLRAKQVTSMFRSSSKPVKWIPDGVVSTEVAYEEDRESYSNLEVNGKQVVGAEETVNSDFMRSMDKAWSTGDFKTISRCIFSELADTDFSAAGTEQSIGEALAVYRFSGRRPSACIGVNFRSEVTYPAFKGSMQVKARTGQILHLELEAVDIPAAFPLDRAERSVDFATVRIGATDYVLPQTSYWFGCFRNTYSCFLNRIDFRNYRRFEANSTVQFGN